MRAGAGRAGGNRPHGLPLRLVLAVVAGGLASYLLLDTAALVVEKLAGTAAGALWGTASPRRWIFLRAVIQGNRHLVAMALLSTAACLCVPFRTSLHAVGTFLAALLTETCMVAGVMLVFLAGELSSHPLPWRNAGGLLALALPALPLALIFLNLAGKQSGTERTRR